MRELPRGTVTFLFTDVEGSTRLLHELGADEYANALAAHRSVLRAAFERHGGVEVDTQGDAFFVAFPTAPGALSAAREAQEALELPVRMGLHTGTPLLAEEGYVGADVHRAARIAAAGHGRQVLVSTATAALVDRDELRDLGEHRLKDLSAPERIFQLGDGEFPLLKTLYRTNLPIPATQFLGREHELAAVLDLLARDDARLLTLTGAGGSGKTRLALHAAGEAAESYPDGVWWVPLAPLTDPAEVGPAAARALGGGGTLPELVDGRRLLLLLDNFEHVVEAAPEVAAVLAECPHADVLVTSRERLRVQGERVYPVPVLERAEARGLFVARARAVQPDFEPDALLDDLCARLDDLPLALELAAARTSLLTVEQLLDRLGNRLDLLKGGRDAETRQQTLRATIEWSYELLEPDERKLLAALSIFRGGWTLEAAEQVADADLELLQSLVDKSLIRRWESGRFGMLEAIREFAAERAEELVDRDLLARRLAEHLIELGDRANLREESIGLQRHDLVRPERNNVEVVLEWALGRGEVDLGLRLMWYLEHFWITGDQLAARRWIDELLARGGADPALRARALRIRGGTFDMTGRPDLALAQYEEVVEAFAALGEEDEAAHVRHRIAHSLFAQGEVDRAERLVEELLERDRLRGRRRDEAIALHLLGEVAYERGRREEAFALVRESAERASEIGFIWWRGLVFLSLADWMRSDGDFEAAEEALREAGDVLVPMGDIVNTGFILGAGARIAAEAGEAERGGVLWGALQSAAEREPARGWRLSAGLYAEWAEGQLGNAEFARGRQHGGKLSPEEALRVLRRETAPID